jgi:release factor glutamine methyltransferase
VLIPRPDSETLVEAVLAWIADRHRPLRILDLGTGSGCLLLALLSELPAASGVGVDRSVQALQLARQNAERLGLAARTGFVGSDWGSALAGGFDLIVSNPPYVAEADWQQLMPEINRYEPRAALVAGSDGLDAYRRILPQARPLLGNTGAIFFEIGAEQAEAVIDIAASAGFQCADIRDDLVGFARCLRLRFVDAPSANKQLGNKAFPV